jgi:hypothetical protein
METIICPKYALQNTCAKFVKKNLKIVPDCGNIIIKGYVQLKTSLISTIQMKKIWKYIVRNPLKKA